MKTVAAVLVETGRPLELADLDVPAMQPGQVLVEVEASGVCHTQLLEARGRRGADRYLPHCLGHEGAGRVLEIGAGVKRVAVGDRVVLSWIKAHGADVPGTVYRWNGRAVHAGGVTTFGRAQVVSENRLTVLPDAMNMDAAVLLGCALPTGFGAVRNTAEARAGESCVVFGCGGVGLCAIAGAAACGCTPIVAVDVRAEKLDIARRLGATHTIDAAARDAAAALAEICAGGADLAIEATGQPAVMRQAIECVRPRGGRAVVIGNAAHGSEMRLNPAHLNQGKRLLGTWGGDSDPDRDYPRYARLLDSGRLDVGPLLSIGYTLERINDALDDLESGRAVRPVVRMHDP